MSAAPDLSDGAAPPLLRIPLPGYRDIAAFRRVMQVVAIAVPTAPTSKMSSHKAESITIFFRHIG
jgi:hypothetical protein